MISQHKGGVSLISRMNFIDAFYFWVSMLFMVGDEDDGEDEEELEKLNLFN